MIGRGIYLYLAEAQRLFRLWAPQLDQEDWMGELLDRYRQAIGQTGEMMAHLGVGVACGHCALRGEGSCCFPGVENNYDEILLFINFLLGYPPPGIKEIKGKCLFVGEQGCKLLARHYYCQRFLCDDLKAVLGEAAVQRLNIIVGHELAVGWKMDQALRHWLRQQIKHDI